MILVILAMLASSAQALSVKAPSPNYGTITPSAITTAGTGVFSGGVGVGTNIGGLSAGVLELDGTNSQIVFEKSNVNQGYVGDSASVCTSGAASSLGIRGVTSIQSCPGGTVGTTLNSTGFGIGTTSPATKLDVNGSAQFGSGATKSTFSATGFYVPVSMTAAQIAAYTPSAAELHGIVTCSNCADAYSVCQATGAVVMGFRLGTSGTTACQ